MKLISISTADAQDQKTFGKSKGVRDDGQTQPIRVKGFYIVLTN